MAMGQQAVELQSAVNIQEYEFEGVKKKHKSDLEDKQIALSRLLRALRTGQEERDVECDEIFNYIDSIVEVVYKGEVVHTRVMTAEERQNDLSRARETVSQ